MFCMSTIGLMSFLLLVCCAVRRKPNIILFVADDLGYGDLASYGHPTQERGAVDKMAEEGIRFTQFYTPHVFCTPSRAAMLTGRYAARSGMIGGDLPVLFTASQGGLPHSEITIAEILHQQGYHTGIVGKWHLGINQYNYTDGAFLPHTHGFSYVGHILPFTLSWRCDSYGRHIPKPKSTQSFLYRNDTIVQQPIHLDNLTATFVQDAKAFIYEHQMEPFFLYLSLPQTHTPMFGSKDFRGKSKRGIYGDQINEMNWAIGEVVDLIKSLDLQEDTLSLFLSDNGPHRELCAEGGSSGLLRGGKGNFYEGGVRIPLIAWWPGTIQPGQRSLSVLSITDLLPTLSELTGGSIPRDRILDGQSFVNQLLVPNTETQDRRPILFMCNSYVMAVRYKQYKIHYRVFNTTNYEAIYQQNCDNNLPKEDIYLEDACDKSKILDNPEVFDLHVDPSEDFPLHSEKSLLYELQEFLTEFVDNLLIPDEILDTSRLSKYLNPCCNPPYCACPVIKK